MIVVTLFQLAQLTILARILGPEILGLMAILMVVIGFSQSFMDMGISNAIIHRRKVSNSQLSSLYWLNIFSGLILSILVALASPLIASFYNEITLVNSLLMLSCVFVINSIGSQFKVLFQKELKFKVMGIIDMCSSLTSFLVAIYFASMGYGLNSLVFAMIAQSIVSSFSYFITGINSFYRPNFRFKNSELTGFYSFGFYQMGERSINYLTANIDTLIIGKLLGMQAVGFYNMAYQLIIFPLLRVNPIVNKVAFPLYAKVQDNPTLINKYYAILLRALSLAIIPFLIFLCFFSKEVVLIVFGDGWDSTAKLIPILVFVGIFKALSNPGGSIILAKGYANVTFWWNLFWIFVITFSIILAITVKKDIQSVPVALALSCLFFGWIWHYLISKIGKIYYPPLLLQIIKLTLLCSLVAWLSKIVVDNIMFQGVQINLIISMMICISFYISYVYFFEKDILDYIRQGAK